MFVARAVKICNYGYKYGFLLVLVTSTVMGNGLFVPSLGGTIRIKAD